MGPAFLIPALMGGARAIYENQKKDPTSGLQNQLRNEAEMYRKESLVDTGGADAQAIKNAVANQIYGIKSGAVSAGRGSTPQTAANVAEIASVGAGQEVAAKQRGRERSDRLRRTATGLKTQAEELRTGAKSRRSDAVYGSLTGGAIGSLGAYGEQRQDEAQQQKFLELISALGYGGGVQ